MTETIQLRQDGEPSENTTQYESPDVQPRQAVCAMYLANQIADQFDEFVEMEVSDDADVEATLTKITGSDDDGNYAVYETAGGSITGLYLSHDALSGVHDGEASPENAPDSVGLTLRQSDSDAFEDAEDNGVDEEEADALVAGSGESESDDEDESEEVEISDEEVGLVDQ